MHTRAALLLAVAIFTGCTATPPPPSLTPPPTSTLVPTSTAPPTRPPTPTAPTPTPPPPTPTVGPTPPSESPPTMFGDGTWRVGRDIRFGTYRTTTYTDQCYWTRLSGFRHGLADVIASRIGSGYQVVTIQPGDRGFDSNGCGIWTTDLTSPLAPGGSFADGTYIVGEDIAPGAYVPGRTDRCYWATLSGFGGTEAEIIDEQTEVEGSHPIVNLLAPIVGFTSSGCDQWSRLGTE